jgi:1-acyl-sn-glycerol-3-phosphate acyltransferase
MLYHFLKAIIGLGIRLYYREIRVKHRERLEHDGPLIILANHPNTLMDAWMVGFVCKKRINYMAKATFFNTPLKMWFLRGLGLVPINRASERRTKNVSNNDSFEYCYRLLEDGKTLVIFPEGTSFHERQLRELKSGAARIALEVLKRNEGALHLRVVPIGLVYSEPEKFRSSVLVNVGEAIDPREFLEGYAEDSIKTARKLTEVFRERMESLLVGAHSTDFDALAQELSILLSSDYLPSEEKGVEKDVERMKRIFAGLEHIQHTQPERLGEINDLVYRIRWRLEKYAIKSDFLDRRYKPWMFARQLTFSVLFLLLGFPFYVFGFVHNYAQYKLVDVLTLRMVKDIEYYAPVALLLSILIYPLTYYGFIRLVDYYVGLIFWQWLSYLLLMPAMGLFAWVYLKYVSHLSFKTNFILLMANEREAIEALKADRQRLRELLGIPN